MSSTTNSEGQGRYCLVTVGATVGFPELIKAALSPIFWKRLHVDGFTDLQIQCGPDAEWARPQLYASNPDIPNGLFVDVFDKSPNLFREHMRLCAGDDGRRPRGVIISHAGTGTILDAWRAEIPLVVVPNKGLLDDHQTEMAKHLAYEGYAIDAKAEPVDLAAAVRKADLLWEDNKSRWPPNRIPSADSSRKALRLWEITPGGEAGREEDTRMATD